ncbi:MAG: TonB-dependent receptor [Chitinophagaceae bacterium]|jgi:iron complex outermembrane receptor protein|nr:TonB-dependent receptor [Chitinophagaceae bacterium]
MNKILGTLIVFTFGIAAQAQVTVKGIVTDTGGQPLSKTIVTIENSSGKKVTLTTNETGFFESKNFAEGEPLQLLVSYTGKKDWRKKITAGRLLPILKIELEDAAFLLQPLEIMSIRASDRAPFTKTNLNAEQIAKVNLGKDLPYILEQTPSVVVNSDAGNGVGYTGIHIRGSDPSRINVTINGIPYNDAESQFTYFVDIPDVVSSVNSIQVQRGVGTSTNGSGAFGATINLSTNEFNAQSYGEINNSYGSFNTWKNTLKAGSGLINNHFTVDVRLSNISSNGYIDRANSSLQSLLFSTAYTSDNTVVRFNFISGKEKTYQAWNGVPQAYLDAGDRTFNSCGLIINSNGDTSYYNNETDNYVQSHYQLFLNQKLSKYWSLNIASFLTRGKGYYEEYVQDQNYSDYGLPDVVLKDTTIAQTDLIRQRYLDNYFFGQTFSFQYKKNNDELNFGGSWTKYNGKHYGNVVWAQAGGIPINYQYYNYPAWKSDQNIYLKWLHALNNYWNVFADMQYRHVKHNMEGFEGNPALNINRTFNFLNPKAGLSYINNGYNVYFSYALANKEPNRDDFQASPVQQPKREQLHDFELGIDKVARNYSFGATAYYMLYKDQLVLTGSMNDVGAYTRINVPDSYRAGIELQGKYIFSNWLNVNANAAFSRNKIRRFVASYDEYINGEATGNQVTENRTNTDISFSPNIIAGGSINIIPVNNVEISFIGKYVGKQYLDNTQSNDRKLNGYYNQNIRAIYTVKKFLFKEWNITAQVNNLFNKKFETNGATYPYYDNGVAVPDNYYFPAATRNYTIAVNVKL